jgi:two-component system phosphate regulon response regulator PhoB
VVRVLVVDSDPSGRQEICKALERSGFELLETESAAQAGEVLRACAPTVVVVDTLLKDQSGFAVCRTIRESPETKDVPVLMLSRSSSDMDRILALEAGADDVVARPFFPRELALRVRSVLRRSGRAPGATRADGPLEYGPIALDERRRLVTAEGQPIALTSTEFSVLALLMSKPGRAFTREEIHGEVWSGSGARTLRVLDTHVKGIRRKLGDFAWVLESVHGVGYRLAGLPQNEPEV